MLIRVDGLATLMVLRGPDLVSSGSNGGGVVDSVGGPSGPPATEGSVAAEAAPTVSVGVLEHAQSARKVK